MSDRDILLPALRIAVDAYYAKTPQPTLLGGPKPDAEMLAPVAAALDRCSAFQAAKGQALFTGRLGLEIDAAELASHLVDAAIGYNPDPAADRSEVAVSWLLRVLTTRKTTAIFCAAIWGASVESEILLPNGASLVPFEALPESYLKSSIKQRSTDYKDMFPWFHSRFHELPRAAYIRRMPEFPYIDVNKAAAFDTLDAATAEAVEYWTVIQAASVGRPLAICYWMGYEDRGLAIEEWKLAESWSLPEIPPFVKVFQPVDADALRSDLVNYLALPKTMRDDLLRSMNRFILGRCRKEIVDRVLDLALAFEIAVSGGDQNLAVSWKVSVRTAQLVGGSLEIRKNNRKIVSDLYGLRNKATHGSSLASVSEQDQATTIEPSYTIYRRLIKCILALGSTPNWNSIELEPRTREDV